MDSEFQLQNFEIEQPADPYKNFVEKFENSEIQKIIQKLGNEKTKDGSTLESNEREGLNTALLEGYAAANFWGQQIVEEVEEILQALDIQLKDSVLQQLPRQKQKRNKNNFFYKA